MGLQLSHITCLSSGMLSYPLLKGTLRQQCSVRFFIGSFAYNIIFPLFSCGACSEVVF